jgi:hypothetical protein
MIIGLLSEIDIAFFNVQMPGKPENVSFMIYNELV